MSDDHFRHRHSIRVRFHHVDRMNVVHNLAYFYFFEEARVEYIRAIGIPVDERTFIEHDRFFIVSPGATAVLIWANPWEEARSLRRVAALRPRRMLTGHGLMIDNPARLLERKADRIEEAARSSVELAAEGVKPRRIVRRVFPKGRFKDRFFEILTSRQFSRLNFVRTAVRLAPSTGDAPVLPQ